MEITIRDYLPDDYSEIMSLWKDISLGGYQRGDNQQIIEDSIALGGRLLVATTESKEIVGTSWMTFDGRRIHLHHFGVKKEFQRKGVGDKLTIESLRFAKHKGYQIKLEVHQTNSSAIALYKKHGFKFLGDYDVYIVREVDNLDF